MQAQTANLQQEPINPNLDQITKEVRFAVVMYGGVSLAIYINGVAQGLFHLVSATAPAEADKPMKPFSRQLQPFSMSWPGCLK